MNENLIFINYRRNDTSVYSQALRLELETRLRAVNVFLDTRSIQAGDIWPNDIDSALRMATVVLSLIGPLWAETNGNGKRRIDEPDDWVARELSFALENKPDSLIPIFVEKAQLPHADQLPSNLRSLTSVQAETLGVASWERDVKSLLSIIEGKFGLLAKDQKYRFPNPDPAKAETNPVSWSTLQDELKYRLQSWTIEFSDDPVHLNNKRMELTRRLEFRTFEQAIEFVVKISEHSRQFDHHPRWMNIWRTLTIWLSTWDAGHKSTFFDIKLARHIENTYKEFSE